MAKMDTEIFTICMACLFSHWDAHIYENAIIHMMKIGIQNGFLGVPIFTWLKPRNSTTVDFVLRLFSLVLLVFTNLWGVVCTYKFMLELTEFLYTWFCSVIGTPRVQVNNFPYKCYHTLSSLFSRRETGNDWVLFFFHYHCKKTRGWFNKWVYSL